MSRLWSLFLLSACWYVCNFAGAQTVPDDVEPSDNIEPRSRKLFPFPSGFGSSSNFGQYGPNYVQQREDAGQSAQSLTISASGSSNGDGDGVFGKDSTAKSDVRVVLNSIGKDFDSSYSQAGYGPTSQYASLKERQTSNYNNQNFGSQNTGSRNYDPSYGGYPRPNRGLENCLSVCITEYKEWVCCDTEYKRGNIPRRKDGFCPPVRQTCTEARSRNRRPMPQPCSDDFECLEDTKCCYDTCSQRRICKPPDNYPALNPYRN